MKKEYFKTIAIKTAKSPKAVFVLGSIIFIMLIVHFYGKVPMSYVSIDINPSIEMSVNAFGKVIDYKAYNNDGIKILNEISIRGKTVKKAVSSIVSKSILEGYITSTKDTPILIDVAMNNDKEAEKLLNNAANGANEVIKKANYKVTIYKNVVAMSYYKEADLLGMTIGRYDLYKKAKEKNNAESTATFKNSSVTDLITLLSKSNIKIDGSTDATSSATTTGQTTTTNTGTSNTPVDTTSGATTKTGTTSTTGTTGSTTTKTDATSGATTKPSGTTTSGTTTNNTNTENEIENEYEDD